MPLIINIEVIKISYLSLSLTHILDMLNLIENQREYKLINQMNSLV